MPNPVKQGLKRGDHVWVQTQGLLLNYSGTITNGGNAQEVIPANPDRKYLIFQNVSDEDMWVMFGANATESQPSIKLISNASFVMEYNFISTQSLSVIAATTGSAFVAWEGS